MEEINHFSHKDHPLKLVENWDNEKGVVCCYGCQEPILDGFAYGCIKCFYFLHTTCVELEPTINHHLHFQHPLILIAHDPKRCWYCDVCGHFGNFSLSGGFSCACSQCDFDACMKCAIVDVAIKESANIKFEHEGHPEHTLTLQLRPAAFLCNACYVKDEDVFYQCNDCTFWIHKTCANLSHKITIPHHRYHPLLLAYSLPHKFYDFLYNCEFCENKILRSHWMYHCANCRFFAHIKCALNALAQASTLRDGPGTSSNEEETDDDLLHFPMLETFNDPLKLLNVKKITGNCYDDDDEIEINHWSHVHPLILNVEPQGNNMPEIGSNDLIKVCSGCVRPLSFRYYSCKEEHSFTLHKYCAKLPRTLEHQLHPDHLLNLVLFKDPKNVAYQCSDCFCSGNMFFYKCESCKFYLM